MKQLLLYSLVGLSLSSISFVAQAKVHRSPQVSSNPQFHHYTDFIDIANEDIKDYINHGYTTTNTGVPQYIFNHVGTESGDEGKINQNGAGGRYNEMFDAELEFNNAVKRDDIIGDQVMSKYRDSHDILWLKVRQMERYNAERERLFSEHRGENGWKDINHGTPKTVHLDVYGGRVGNYRAEQLAAYRLNTGVAPSGKNTPHEDDYGRNGGQVNADHMNNLGYISENVMTPRDSYLTFLPHGTDTNTITTGGHTPDIQALEKMMFNGGAVDSPSWGSDGYSAFIIERVKSNADVTKITISDHLKNGLPNPSDPDWEPIGHFVSIMEDENVNGAGTMVTPKSYATVDEFGMKHSSFVAPEGLLHVKGKSYVKITLKSDDPKATFEADILVDGKAVDVLDSTGKKIYDAGCPWGGIPASSAYDPVNKEYNLYLEVDPTKTSVHISAYLYNSAGHGTGNFNFFGDKSISRVDPDTPPIYPDGGLKEGSVGEKKTGDDFRTKDTLFTNPSDTQTAILSGPFADKQAIVNYQTIEVDGLGKIALDDPKTVIEYGYGSVVDQEPLSKKNVAYLSNRGIVMATNGAKAVKLNDTDIFVNEGVLYADNKSIAIEMNNHDNIIQLRNDLIEGVIEGGDGQDTLLLSKPKHQMDERGLDKSALDTDKYTLTNITLKSIEQIHAQSGDWYFNNGKNIINLGRSNLAKATVLPWAKNDASGLTDQYDYTPQNGNITFLGDISVDTLSTNPVVFAKNVALKGMVILKNITGTTGRIDLSNLFKVKDKLLINADNIKLDGIDNKDAKLVVGQYDRPLTGSVLLGTSKAIVIVDHGKSLPVNYDLISQLQTTDKNKIAQDQVGVIADSPTFTVTNVIHTTGDGSVGVWAGENGKDITIEKSIIANAPHSKAIELNRKNNTLTIYDDITGMIDAGNGNDTLILSATSNKPHTIKGEIIGFSNIETHNGQWIFDNAIELSAVSNISHFNISHKEIKTDTSLPSSHASSAPQNTPPVAPTLHYYVSPLGTLLPYAHAVNGGGATPMNAQVVNGTLIFSGKLTFDVDPVNKVSSHIKADNVELTNGYAVRVTSLVANPGVTYTTTLIESSHITNKDTDEEKNGYSYNDGLWKVNTYYDDNGYLHANVKASSTVYYKTSALDYNDDVTFGISNQVAKYRTDSVVGHGSKYLDFSVSGNTSGAYQNLSLLSTQLNVSTPLLTHHDSRNLMNIQLGYYHGSGTQADFNRSVNAYTFGGSMKVYNPFNKQKKAFLRSLWLSTGFDFGLSQQYNIARYNEHFNQYATKGKENDLFTTNTMLSGLDLYGHLKNTSNIKISITPYAGIGFNLTKLGKYTETAVNPLKIDSQYRLNMYGIFGIHTKAMYKLKNSQRIGIGANIETNMRFKNKPHNRNYSYAHYNSGKPTDNTYKHFPLTISLNTTYEPRKYVSLFTKLSGSTQEIYNYNISLGAKIKF